MYFQVIFTNTSINHPINGKGTVNYSDIFKYTGEWENGMKVNEGILETKSYKLKVKIKYGQIYKCIQILEYKGKLENSWRITSLPPLKSIKVGDFYKEEYSKSENRSFLFIDDFLSLDGKAFPIDNVRSFNLNTGNLILAILKKDSNSSKRSIIEFRSGSLKYYGNSMNLIPNGNYKILYEYLIIKGNIKGHYFNGPCIVKHPEFNIIFETYLNNIIKPIKVFVKSLKSELYFTAVNTDLIFDVDGEKKHEFSKWQLEEIASQIDESTKILRLLISNRFYLIDNITISNLLAVDTIWKIFEKKIQNKNNYFRCFTKEKIEVEKNDGKCFERLKNMERYEGHIIKGKFEGFGKYFYADGSVYVGEFKNNLRDGLGNFRFKDGRKYKGYWKDGFIHRKGSLINGNIKLNGVWERNQLKKGSVCAVYEEKESKIN